MADETKPRLLVTGWFSFELMGATAGDLICRDQVVRWARDAGWAVDVALAAPFDQREQGVDWRAVSPGDYQKLVFVCGPFGYGPPVDEMLDKFDGVPMLGVNLSMLQPLGEYQPFEVLWERDSDRAARPDLVLLSETRLVPMVALVLVEVQKEYGDQRARHAQANAALQRLLAGRDVAVVEVDTRLDTNRTGLHSAGQVEAVIAKADAVCTTRLHGTVIGLKHGVPPVACDPIAGGAKIKRQCETLGWPQCFVPEQYEHDPQQLEAALDWCLSPEGRSAAAATRQRARQALAGVPGEFQAALGNA
jgi:hypothetical protein